MTEREVWLLARARATRRLALPPPFLAPGDVDAPVDAPEEVLRPARDAGAWFAEPFPAGSAAVRAQVARLVAQGGFTVHDTIAEQLAELVETRLPALQLSRDELRRRVAQHLDGTPAAHHGTWFLYPWSRRAVHLLPEAEFRELRSSRNRNKISAEEQERLRGLRIGIIGLSVGGASAMALAMEQVGGELLLADFDSLSLSNLNRLRAGVHELGLPKAIVTARAIAELDPYVRVRPYREGITDENLEAFLRPDGRPLDLVVEECDDLYMKVRVRERARELRIPVVMETSDRGLLDVERFDLEPDRPVFHGLIGATTSEEVRRLPKKERIPFVLRIVGERTISPRMAASLIEIDSTLKTWPQLASAIWLGAGALADTVRRIALGQLTSSGRFYVDLEQLVRDGAGEVALEPAPTPTPAPIEEARVAPTLPLAPCTERATPSLEQVRTLAAYATLAPSGGNCQPWRFRWNGERLRLVHDRDRSRSLLDVDDLASWLACGAAVENASLAARQMGLEARVALAPDPREPAAVCDLRFAAGRAARAEDAALAAAIPARVTNRRLGPRAPLGREDSGRLLAAVEEVPGAALHLVEEPERLAELGEVLGRCDRLRFLSRTMHAEMMAEVRWSADEVRRTRDGIDVATLELSPTDLAALRVTSSWGAMELLGKVGGGAALERPARKAMAAASAAALVTVDGGTSRAAFFAGGRAMQRVWLEATVLGLAVQPMAPLGYLLARLERGGDGLTSAERATLRELRSRLAAVFPEADGRAAPMLLRLSRAPAPTARALRRHVEDVLDLEG
jgi:tRNA A37 threonylcarbamoyladenosine dehydratase/nitroreductase